MPSRKIVASLEEIRDAIREEVKKELKDEFIFDVCIKQIQSIYALKYGGTNYNPDLVYKTLHYYNNAVKLILEEICKALIDPNIYHKVRIFRSPIWFKIHVMLINENREWKSKNTKRVNIN